MKKAAPIGVAFFFAPWKNFPMNNPVNLGAVAVCALSNAALGALWYSVLFRKTRRQMAGVEIANSALSETRAKMGYRISILCYLLMAWILAHFVKFTGATTAWQGVQLGALLWLGFSLPTMLPTHFFSERPLRHAWINIGFPLVGLCLMGAILALWR